MGSRITLVAWSLTLVALLPLIAAAQSSSNQAASQNPQTPPAPLPSTTITVTVVGTTPLVGIELPIDQVAAPVQTLTGRNLETSGALDLPAYLDRRLNGVHVTEMQGNPFQTDVNYRGYTASPLLGTPQGLSVYMDGVRLNQPFGDVVSWDLIPKVAIFSGAMMPGSNPLFGLNTLGGALSLQTKDGRNSPGTKVQAIYGNDVRRALEFEHGGSRTSSGINWYVAGNLFAEDGWRDNSPSEVRQLFGKLGWGKGRSDVSVSLSYADNTLNGNGLQELGFLDRDYASVYTKPDETNNQSTFLNATVTRAVSDRITLSLNGYFRDINTDTLNGDINEASLDQAVYQPTVAEQAALFAAGYITAPVVGADASNTPFPYLRCVGNVLLNDEPAERCNGLLNRGQTDQRNGGLSGQITLRERRHQLTAGGSLRSQQRRFHSSNGAWLSQSRSQRHRHWRVRRWRDRRRDRRRAVRRASRSRWNRPHMEPVRDGHDRAPRSVAPDALGPLQSNDRRQQRPHHARRRTGIARRASRVQPIQPRCRHHLRPVEPSEPVCRLQRRKPRGDVDRARMRGPRTAVQAAECDGWRSAARPGRDADVRGRRARRTRPSQLARRLLPRAER